MEDWLVCCTVVHGHDDAKYYVFIDKSFNIMEVGGDL